MENKQSPKVNGQRILWVDYAKAIGIYLVILAHLKIAPDYAQFIFAFHMPLFFFISGYLEKSRAINETIAHGIKTLIIPYFILYLLSFIFWIPSVILWHKDLYENTSMINALVIKPLAGMLLGMGHNTDYSTMINIPLWFLIALFFVKIIHSMLENALHVKLKGYMVCTLAIAILVFLLKQIGVNLPFSIGSAFMAFPFFAIGYLLKILNQSNEAKYSFALKLVIIFISFTLTALLSKYNGMVDINEFNYGKNIGIFYLNAIIGTVIIVLLSLLFKKLSSIIRIISTGTIFILAFHSYFAAILVRILNVYNQELNLFLGILISLVTLISMIPAILLAKKYIPIMMGGRK